MEFMKILDYMKTNRLKQEDFAAQIGVSQGTLSRYINGSRIPTPQVFASIYKKTDGQVSPNDFYDLEPAEDTTPAAGSACPDPNGGADA